MQARSLVSVAPGFRLLAALALGLLPLTATLAAAAPTLDTHGTQTPTLQTSPGNSALSGLQQVLPAEQAFPLVALVESDNGIVLHWQLEPGYYLYHKSLAVRAADGTALALELPAATTVTDEFCGEVEVYYDTRPARIAPDQHQAAPGSTLVLELDYQGCLQERYCYPPQQRTLTLELPAD